MADNTTTTTPQSNGVPLSGLPALTAPVNGEELLLITKNNQSLKTTAAALKAYINAEMATLTGMQQAVKAVSDRIDTLVNGDASSAIDTFNEIEAFLTGITDTETLTGLLAELKSAITAETDNKLSTKVDKVTGKGLSANDYTDEDKAKLGALPNKSELDSSLGAKLDKSEWDEEHGQFTVVDKYINIEGRLSRTVNARATEFICLNYKYDIKTDAKSYADTVYVITFYDSAGKRIKGYRTQDLTYGEDGFATLTPSEFPTGAAYIRLSCFNKPYSGFTWSHSPTQEAREGAVSEAIQAAKLALFIDEFNAAAGDNGKYDLVNAPDPQHPFYLNTLWLTYQEALTVYEYGRGIVESRRFIGSTIRTNIPEKNVTANIQSTIEYCFVGGNNIEVINVISLKNLTLVNHCFLGMPKLKAILGDIRVLSIGKIDANSFKNLPMLETICLHLGCSASLAGSPLLSLASLQYLVTNAANTSAITVTVHPTVYAKLTDTSAELQPYLPENLLGSDLAGDTSHIVKISNGVQVTGGNSYFRLATKPDLVKGRQGKMTISCDVEGLQEGESIIYRLGSRNLDKGRPIWNITSNGRAVFSFNANLYEDSTNPRNACLFFDTDKSYTGSGLKLTNFKLSYGEHETLPYTPPLSSMTDAALKEKAEWASLMQIAEAKQIEFATTE